MPEARDALEVIEAYLKTWSPISSSHKYHAQAILTALSSAGMTVVPVEPSEAMRNAGYRVYTENRDGYTALRHYLDVYRAMVTAALPPLASGGG